MKLLEPQTDDIGRTVLVVRDPDRLPLPVLLSIIARRVRINQCVDIAVQLYQRIDARKYRQRWGSPLMQRALFTERSQ